MRPRAGVDVYLLPAVVGGGLGDIMEVLAAGRRLARAGASVYLYRGPGRPMPRSVGGPRDWPPLTRVSRLRPTFSAAITVAPSFGVSAAPDRPGALGRAGPWAEEVAAIEAKYGPERTLHVSLEEFARTLTSLRETRERLREGGVRARSLSTGVARARARGELKAFRRAFERFRAFDRPNVLHLFATFRAGRAFAREFPHAVQVGPLWPDLRSRRPPGGPRRRREWVWYASPASAERIAGAVRDALRAVPGPPIAVHVRTPRPWRSFVPTAGWTVTEAPEPGARWRRRFALAELRIVTGSRSLLEALEVGGPFLYFNGVLGNGSRTRRHRPEKLVRLLELARRAGLPDDVRRDLADFGRGRRVGEVVRRAASHEGGWRGFSLGRRTFGFDPPYDDAGALLVRVARRLAPPGARADDVVARVRARSNL